MSLLDSLNPAQKEAVTSTEGPLLVFAGAGSGKTRVLTYRIAHILEQGRATSNELLVVTFTNKAAAEVRERVSTLVGPERFSYLGTFHSCCLRMLRAEHETVGLPSAFSIYDTADSTAVIKEAARELGIPEEKLAPKRARTLISNAKNQLQDPETFARKAPPTPENEYTAKIYRIYERILRENNALDFDDLLGRTVEMLNTHPQILEKYQQRFKYILVDEYQDVNYTQYVLIQKLASLHRNICVVGDDDQSIYGFRGADVSLILRFEKDFPNARVVKLEQNYRSTQAVLDVANSVVRNNSTRSAKSMWTVNDKGTLPGLYEAGEGRDEARFIVRRIRELVGRGRYEYGQVAVLYRTNAQSRVIEDALKGQGFPYVVVGGMRFWDRKEIRDLVAYLRVIANPSDELSLRRIINVPPRSLGPVTLTRLAEAAERHQVTLYEILGEAERLGDLGPKAIVAISELRKLLEDTRTNLDNLSVADVIDKIVRTIDYKAFIAPDRSPESTSRLENLDELKNTAAQFEKEVEASGEPATLANFLNRVSLSSDVDDLDEKGGAVSLLTLHAAKGLEFPVVFLFGLEEGYLPHARVFDFPQEVEEERRLAYVGLTRAQALLFLTYARYREVFGQSQPRIRSRFLDEIPLQMMETLPAEDFRFEAMESRRRDYTPPSSFTGYGQPVVSPPPSRANNSARSTGGGRNQAPRSSSSRSVTVRPNSTTSTRSSAVRTVRSVPTERLSTPMPEEKPVHVCKFGVGDRVQHKVFGEGTVVKIDGKTVTASYAGIGEKAVLDSFLAAAN